MNAALYVGGGAGILIDDKLFSFKKKQEPIKQEIKSTYHGPSCKCCGSMEHIGAYNISLKECDDSITIFLCKDCFGWFDDMVKAAESHKGIEVNV